MVRSTISDKHSFKMSVHLVNYG